MGCHVRYRVDSDFVALVPEFLRLVVVVELVAHEECRFDRATVGILPVVEQNLVVEFPVLVVDGIVECQNDHLRGLRGLQVPRYLGPIRGAETVG